MTPRRRRGDPPDVDTGNLEPDEVPETTDARERLELLHTAERRVAQHERRRFGDEVDHYTTRIRNVLALAGMVCVALTAILASFGWRFSSPREANTMALQMLRQEAMDSLKSIRREQAEMRTDVDTIKARSVRNMGMIRDANFMLCLMMRKNYPELVAQVEACRVLNGTGAALFRFPQLDTARDATRVATADLHREE